uniref:Beta-hexosaminidase A n=1 Tax=Plectus sambesii TaxID=2011161 RepID=A0A914W7E3_9BILA
MKSCHSLLVAIVILQFLTFGETTAPGQHWYYGRPAPGLMTQGGVWPLPWNITYGTDNHTIVPSQFQLTSTYSCDILSDAFLRYPKLMFPSNSPTLSIQGTLTSLTVTIVAPCPTGVPQLEMDESYQLTILPNNPQAVLTANEVWGALRGLETFSQLIFFPDLTSYQIRTATVNDRPRFPHRGVLFDTSRHFLPLRTLRTNLDIMAQNKLNTFHWHIVDSEAFPYVSTTFPNLSKMGAYTPTHVYQQSDVKDVIAYARLRGIRVVVEFDTPGHTGSWGLGQPGLLSACFDSNNNPDPYPNIIDPTQNTTYQFLASFFSEVLSVFPDNYIHLGGDEVLTYTQNCWLNNPQVHQYMIDHGYGNDTTLLENEYFNRFLPLVLAARNNTKIVVWQEVLDNKVAAPNTIAHVWKGYTSDEQMNEMASVTAAGHLAILSSCWYLNYISYGDDWRKYYACDPTGFNGTDAQKKLVLGGELAMWGELVDATNILPRMWPRGSSVAEQLWSDRAQANSAVLAWPRLHEFRCRLLRRGYPAEPPEDPSYCPEEWDVEYYFPNNPTTITSTTSTTTTTTTPSTTTPCVAPATSNNTTISIATATSASSAPTTPVPTTNTTTNTTTTTTTITTTTASASVRLMITSMSASRKLSVSSASDSDNPPTPTYEPSDSDSVALEGKGRKTTDIMPEEDREKTPKAVEAEVDPDEGANFERRTSTPTTLPRFPHSVENLHALAQQLGEKQDSVEQAVGSTPPAENGSPEKKESESTVFNQISYLGCSSIENPSSEKEMLKIVALMNAEKEHDAIAVTLSVPSSSFGTVRLFDTATQAEMATFPVHRIRFCARGQTETPERDCFALSFTQQNATANERAIHQCHVFRCYVPEAAGKALLCFAAAFRNTPISEIRRSLPGPKSNATSPSTELTGTEEDYQFEAFLEMKEEDSSKKGYTLCPQEKNCFKLRRGREKRVVMHLQQISGPRTLAVQKCFGLLLAAGRNLRQSDMHLLDMQSMGRGNDNRVYIIEALWDPNAHNFEVLNTETPRETRVFMTVAADVILAGIDEPVRFNVECKARIFHQHERFWYVTRKAVVDRYFLTTRKVQDAANSSNSNAREVVRFESVTERERSMARLSLGRSPSKMVTQLIHPADDDESDSDEPLLSGSGDVCRECSEDVLSEWAECLRSWKDEANKQRPKELNGLIRNGIPDVLRGEVWQLLAGVQNDPEMMDTYRCLLGKECPSEQVILRDIHRTFPAHEFFKEAGGVGQDSLYKISKAYSLYDEEVGYCQGLSFLGASLLLHMPEEQAFCVLVKIMFDYGLRDLFKLGFDALHLRFYQLQRLIDDYIPDLSPHFADLGIETHMFASQWFLTLFTAKFPLQMVFFIIDLFLSEGINTIFHISLALLRASKKDLLQLDFEGVLKYFRVALPRKYRTESNAKELIHQAVKLRLSHKRLSKYEKDYLAYKKTIETTQDPLERANQEVQNLKETVMRLERENDDLAHELVTSKI